MSVLSDFADRTLSIRQMFYLAIMVLVPYFAIGLVWAFVHRSHVAELSGLDRVFSFLGEIVAWPVLIIANVSLI